MSRDPRSVNLYQLRQLSDEDRAQHLPSLASDKLEGVLKLKPIDGALSLLQTAPVVLPRKEYEDILWQLAYHEQESVGAVDKIKKLEAELAKVRKENRRLKRGLRTTEGATSGGGDKRPLIKSIIRSQLKKN